ncbi:branched-subunit amino acid transport protein AzlD [Palleronia aestuarii]|uniref:Branched-subunit amino acid transport protein AzlD n=1 Tax=Palleronia aestuarii TaxID=568105 RepID=A0A2W7NIN8_9RHOB|nr:AzlD domain-containing protein [Palleronia aestuarii]PZX16554.1 branched-subunit amino acid transport protein AzlD [Palleronia aestuarii]
MTGPYWAVIALLAAAAFLIRVAGLAAGGRIRASRHAWILDDLPGLIVVSLVASSLAGQPWPTWIAAGIAFGVGAMTNHVILTMAAGVAAFAGLAWLAG